MVTKRCPVRPAGETGFAHVRTVNEVVKSGDEVVTKWHQMRRGLLVCVHVCVYVCMRMSSMCACERASAWPI